MGVIMNILGLNIGHNATACLLRDGKIVGCVSEERFSRVKNHAGVPVKSINYLLKSEGLVINDIDEIVLDDHYDIEKDPYLAKKILKNFTNKTRFQKISSRLFYKYPGLHKNYSILKDSLFGKSKDMKRIEHVRNHISRLLKFPRGKITFINHHLAHALATLFNIDPNEKTLIFTLDAEGSGLCATVSLAQNGKLKLIAGTRKGASIGALYGNTTICLGMKPLEHEFKVMGLAPYAKKDKVMEAYEKLKQILWLNKNLKFGSKFHMFVSDYFIFEEMKFTRFDNIAGAVQKLTEELTYKWIKEAIAKTGVRNIALSGGVFMNVKASQKISEMPEVKSIFVMPSCGDEVNSIGSCFYGYRKYCEKNKIPLNFHRIEDLYLGPEYNEEYVKNFIAEGKLKERYHIKKVKNVNKVVAKLLAQGEIVARCSGKSEWGARALGNRSILSNANNTETIRILNETIKDRDFWMPFTPSIIDKFEKKYVVNPKKISAPYMCITFDSTEQARKDIPAAMHPYDQTLRPQIVTKDYNPDYYEVIEEFSKLTGRGGILNTSFNLHGEPNVLTPEDAIHTVDNSDLKYLVVGDYLFEKIKKVPLN